jgi:phosphomannomutase/phosphoglucomutase
VSKTEAEVVSGTTESDARKDIWPSAFIAIGISVTGVVIAFVVIWWLLLSIAQQEAQEAQNHERLAEATSILNARIAEFEVQVRTLAASQITQEQIVAAASALPTTLPTPAYTGLLPSFRRISVFPRGAAEVDLEAAIPLNFAALDLIRRAENEPFAGPEVSLNNRDLVYAATPVTVQGKVAGTLFVAVDTSWFAAPFGGAGNLKGRYDVMQSFQATEPTPVLGWGQGSSEGANPVEGPTANPNWTLQFQPNQLAAAGPGFASLLPPFALCLAFILGGVYLGASHLGRKLAQDLGVLRSAIGRVIRDGSTSPLRYQLKSIRAFAAGLESLRPPAPDPSPAIPGEGAATTAAGKPKRANTASSGATKKETQGKVGARINELLAVNRDGVEEEDFLEVSGHTETRRSAGGMEVEENPGPADFGIKLDPSIFRAYDIRGLAASNLSSDIVYWIGRAFAGEAAALEQLRVIVGRDGRLSSPTLHEALINGLLEGGVDVIDIGMVPTPVLYFATHELGTGTGVMITGSHNPPEFNGLKMVLAGVTLADERIARIRERIDRNDLPRGEGTLTSEAVLDRYVARVAGDVAIADSLKVVVDCGNGVGGLLAPRLLEEMGCEVVPLYCDVDGSFPNHHPDPADPANLEDLVTVVQAEGADLGIAFDGDADRIGIVTNRGEIIWPDKLLMLFSQDIVGRNPGADIIYDVKCSRHLSALISEYGGRPIMWKTGHSHIKAKLQETGALLAGEFSGHICFGERWYGFDDALYAAARLLEIVGAEGRSVADLFAQFPVTFTTPELKVKTTDSAKFAVMEKLRTKGNFGDGTVTTIDGIRVDYADGWGLVRPSNTGPVLSLRFEADGQAALQRIRNLFQTQLSAIDPALKIG